MAQDINLGSVTLEISDAQSKIDKLSGAIDKMGQAADPARTKTRLQNQVNAVKATLTGLTNDVTSMVANFNRALEGLNGSSVTNSLDSLSKSVAQISNTLDKTFSNAIKDMSKDVTQLDFTNVITQLRTLSNAFSMTSKEAVEQQEALKKTGKYEGDAFGLKGLSAQVTSTQKDMERLFNIIGKLKREVQGMYEVNAAITDFGASARTFNNALRGMNEVTNTDWGDTIPKQKELSKSIKNVLSLASDSTLKTDPDSAYEVVNTNLSAVYDSIVEYNNKLEDEVARTNEVIGNIGGKNQFTQIENQVKKMTSLISTVTNATVEKNAEGKGEWKATTFNGISQVINGASVAINNMKTAVDEMKGSIDSLIAVLGQAPASFTKFFSGMGETRLSDFNNKLTAVSLLAKNLNAEFEKMSQGGGSSIFGNKAKALTEEEKHVQSLYTEWKQLLDLQAQLSTERKGIQPGTNLYATLFDELNNAGKRIADIKKELGTISETSRDLNLENLYGDKKNGYLAQLKAETVAAEEAANKEKQLNLMRAQYAKEHPTETQKAEATMQEAERNQNIAFLKAQVAEVSQALADVGQKTAEATAQLNNLGSVDLSKLIASLTQIATLMQSAISLNNDTGTQIAGGQATKEATGSTNFEEAVKRLETVKQQADILAQSLPAQAEKINSSFKIDSVAESIDKVHTSLNNLNTLIQSMGVKDFSELAKAVNATKDVEKSHGSKGANKLYDEYNQYLSRYLQLSKEMQNLKDDTPSNIVTGYIQDVMTLKNLMDETKASWEAMEDKDRNTNREERLARRLQYGEVDLSRSRAEIKEINSEYEEGKKIVEGYYNRQEELNNEKRELQQKQIGQDKDSDYWKELERQRKKAVQEWQSINRELKNTDPMYRDEGREAEIRQQETEISNEIKLRKAKQATNEADKARKQAESDQKADKKKTDLENAQKEKEVLKEITETYKRINDIKTTLVAGSSGLLDDDELMNEISQLTLLEQKLEQLKASQYIKNPEGVQAGEDQDYVSQLYSRMEAIIKLRQKALEGFEKTGDSGNLDVLNSAFQALYGQVQNLGDAYRDLAMEQDMVFRNSQITQSQQETSDSLNELISKYEELQKLYEAQSQRDLTKQEEAQLERAKQRIEEIKNEHKEFEKLQRVKEAASSAENARAYAEDAINLTNSAKKYEELTHAVEHQKEARKSGNVEQQAQAMTVIDSINQQLTMTKTYMGTLDKESDAYKKLSVAVMQFENALKGAKTEQKQIEKSPALDKLAQLIKSYVLMRGIRTLWKNATSYVKDYYDALNEIRIVTGKTESESLSLGDSYRQLASEMKVTSQELAESAVTLYRQGLDDEAVEDRLKYITMYSKTSGLEISTATELMTATINAYSDYTRAVSEAGEEVMKTGYSAEEVGSMFTAVGNAAASSGEEIGTAAQKVASVAGEAGLSLEHLSAYIATLSEKTRLAPESIGTSLNTIISRLRQIKQNGFNQDDETKINDVAKALKTVGVSLMDSEGNWRNLNEIFEDIGNKWDDMSDKQKSYIATTMAGTRQQNYFIALMKDLAQAQEGTSRAMELYKIAVESSGSLATSYDTYMESATAASDRFKQSLENVYSAIMNADVVKGLYDVGASIANGFAAATEATNGFNVIIPVTMGLLIGLAKIIRTVAVDGLAASISGQAQGFTTWWASAAIPSKIGIIITGIALLTAAISGVVNLINANAKPISKNFENVNEAIGKVKTSLKEANDIQAEYTTTNNQIRALRDEYVDLATKTNKTKEDNERLQEILSQLESLAPGVARALSGVTGEYERMATVVQTANEAILENERLARIQAQRKASEGFSELETASKEYREASTKNESVNAFIEDYLFKWARRKGYSYIRGAEGLTFRDSNGEVLTYSDIAQQYVQDTGKASYGKGSYEHEQYKKKKEEYDHALDVLKSAYGENILDLGGVEKFLPQALEGYITNDVILENQAKAIAQNVRNSLLLSMDTLGLPDYMASALESETNAIINELLYDQNGIMKEFTEADLSQAAMEVKATSNDYQEASEQLGVMKESIQAMYDTYSKNPTKENQNAYNAMVTQAEKDLAKFGQKNNKVFTHITDEMQEKASKALEEAAQAQSEDSETEKEAKASSDKAVAQARQALTAWAEGFDEQRREIIAYATEKDENGVERLSKTKALEYMSNLRDRNEAVYNRLVSSNGWLDPKNLISEGISEQNFSDLMDMWARNIKGGVYKNQYNKAMGDMGIPDPENIEDAWQQVADAYQSGGESAVYEMLATLDEVMSGPIIKRLDELGFGTGDGLGDQEGMSWSSVFAQQDESSLEALLAYYTEQANSSQNASNSTTKANEEIVRTLENLNNSLSVTELENVKGAWEEQDETQKEALTSMFDLEEGFFDSFDASKYQDLQQKIKTTLQKAYEDSEDINKKILEGTSILFDPSKQGTSEFGAQTEKMRAEFDTFTKALGDAYAIQNKTVEEGTEAFDRAIASVASYAQVDEGKLRNGMGWSSIWLKLNEDAKVYENTLTQLDGYLGDVQENHNIAEDQKEAWELVSKAVGMTKEQVREYGNQLLDSRSEIDIGNRKKISSEVMKKSGWDVEDGSYSTFLTQGAGVELSTGALLQVNVTPILPNGEVLSPDELYDYVENYLYGASNIDELFERDSTKNGGKGILMNVFEGINDETIGQSNALAQAIHSMSDTFETMGEDSILGEASLIGEYEESWGEAVVRISEDAEDARSAIAGLVTELMALLDVDPSSIESFSEFLSMMQEYREYGFDESYKGDQIFGSLSESEDGSKKQLEYLERIAELSQSEEGIEDLAKSWKKLSTEQRKAVKDMSGLSDEYFESLEKGTKDIKKFGKEAEKAFQKKNIQNLEKQGKALEGTSELLEMLGGDTAKATKAYDTMMAEVRKNAKGFEAYNKLVGGAKKGTEEYKQALSDLSTATGMAEEDFKTEAGLNEGFQRLTESADTLEASLASVAWALAAINGSSFDPSTWSSGLLTLGSGADDASNRLANLINNILRVVGARIHANMSEDGTAASISVDGLGTGSTGSGDSDSNGNGGGGGGGGGGKKDDESSKEDPKAKEQTRWLESIKFQADQLQDVIDKLEKYRSRYEMQGYLTGAINTIVEENKKLREQTEIYKQNKAAIQERINATRAELAGLQKGTKEYDQVLARLEELQEAYNEYDQSIIDNQNTILENGEAVKELRKQIKELESTLRDTIRQAIEDRNQREEDSANAYLEMQEQIIDAIKERYEKEREEVERTTELKIKALEEETNALSDALDERKKLSEEQDKAVELAKLQAQYARIVADPTRAKEALEIQKKILELQEEMAWDAAEKEVEKQQDAIEKQIEDLEDYQERMDEYYDKLLEDDNNFAEEAANVLGGTQEEIIAWLKENDEAFANSTAEQQAQMIKEWEDTLNTMNGITETVWAEVEEIIAGGDEAIIQFLLANSQEYREANAYQQQIMLKEWRDQFLYLHRAYENIRPNVSMNDFIDTTETYNENAGNGGGGGGGGSGGGPTKPKDPAPKESEYVVQIPGMGKVKVKATSVQDAITKAAGSNWSGTIYVNDKPYQVNKGKITADSAVHAVNTVAQAISPATNALANTVAPVTNTISTVGSIIGNVGGSVLGSITNAISNIFKTRMTGFDTGGVATNDGIAFVHDKERVLTGPQNEALERLLETMESLDRIYVRLPYLNPQVASGSSSNITFEGGINIQVEQLIDDDDYDEVAEKVMDYINERMGRGMSVGGIRVS